MRESCEQVTLCDGTLTLELSLRKSESTHLQDKLQFSSLEGHEMGLTAVGEVGWCLGFILCWLFSGFDASDSYWLYVLYTCISDYAKRMRELRDVFLILFRH